MPYDVRGTAPTHAGETHNSQAWREGPQRFANRGGQDKEKYSLFFRERKEPFFHPKCDDGSGAQNWHAYIFA